MLEGVAHTQVHAPIKIVGVEMLGKEAAVTRTEVELQRNRCAELVFHAEDAVGPALAEVAARVEPPPGKCTP